MVRQSPIGLAEPWQRLRSAAGFTATSHYFVMDWAAIWIDIAGGLLIAGALAAWVPDSFWRSLFLEDHATIHDGVLFSYIELNDLAGDLLSDQLLQLGCVFGSAA